MSVYGQFLIYLLVLIGSCYGFGITNFHVTQFQHCDSKVKYPLTFNTTFRTVGKKQYIDGLLVATIPIDSDLRSNVTVEELTGRKFVYLFSITENDSCKAMHKYLGEFVYDLERNAQLISGMCPIPKGRYQIHNTPLNFDKITLQTFPFGKLRFTEIAMDKQNNVCTCLKIEVDNRAS